VVPNKKSWTITLLALAIGALLLLAAGLSRLELLPGRPFSWDERQADITSRIGTPAQGSELNDFWKTVITLAFWTLLPLSLLYIILSREARKRVLRDIVWVAATLATLYLLIRALQRFVTPLQAVESQAQGTLPPSSGELSALAEFVSHPPGWLVFGISVLLIALVLGVIWYLGWRALRRPPLELLVQEAHAALEELNRGRDLKDTVLLCYREMSRVLREQRGLRRARAMTPREFEEHLERMGLHSEHIQRLTRLFEAVRYGAEASSAHEEREARICLEAIVQAYGRSS
jgi:hypothetical protein